jgi:hypothetical protein
MATMPDAAATSLANLFDEAQYVRVPGVPVFEPHERPWRDAAGHVIRVTRVDPAKLRRIAANIARRYRRSAMPVVLSRGHTLPDPATPEERQPPPIGYSINPRVAPIGDGSKLGLLVDEYVRRDAYDEYKTYPFRSAEYFDDREEITHVACLRRPPQLDTGAMVYARDGRSYLYAMGAAMPESETLIEPDEPPDAERDEGDRDFMERLARLYPEFGKMYASYTAPAPEPPAPAEPAVHPAPNPPAAEPYAEQPSADISPEKAKVILKEGEAKGHPLTEAQRGLFGAAAGREREGRMRREQDAIRYQRLEETQKAQAAEIAALKHEKALAEGRALVVQLNGEGYYFRDAAAEAERFARLSEPERAERVAEVRACYRRDPAAGPMLRVAPAAEDRPGVISPRQEEAAEHYQRRNPGCTWEDALKATQEG